MADVLLFHHALGRTPGVLAFADDLRRAGHTVHVPDLYEGRSFATVTEGVAFAESVGFGEIIARGVRYAEELSHDLVYAGFSLGVGPAQSLAQTRDGARGALLMHACLPVTEFGTAWPANVPAQIHGMNADPWFVDSGDLDAARALVASSGVAQLFLYDGSAHLFADASTAEYDEAAARLLVRRVHAFLSGLSPSPS